MEGRDYGAHLDISPPKRSGLGGVPWVLVAPWIAACLVLLVVGNGIWLIVLIAGLLVFALAQLPVPRYVFYGTLIWVAIWGANLMIAPESRFGRDWCLAGLTVVAVWAIWTLVTRRHGNRKNADRAESKIGY